MVRDGNLLHILAQIIVINGRLHRQQINLTLEGLLSANRQLEHGRLRAETRNNHANAALETRASAIHFIDKTDARDTVLISLAPNRLGLRLHASDAIEDHDAAIEHAQGALNLDGKIYVAGGINNIDPIERLAQRPLRRRCRRRNGNATLLLLLHPVHRRGSFMNLADFIRPSGVEQDALGRRGLARVNVGDNADIADLIESELAWHTDPYS